MTNNTTNTNTKNDSINFKINQIPNELQSVRQWIVWRIERDGDKDVKRPYQAMMPSQKARVNDPNTWSSFKPAIKTVMNKQANGVGFVFTKDDPYCFIDLDHCIDEHGEIEPKAKRIIDMLSSYTEISQSGHGIHVIVKARIPDGMGNRSENFEIYDCGRYCAMTGNILNGYPNTIEERQEQINAICKEIFKPKPDPEPAKQSPINLTDDKIIQKLNNAVNSDKFKRLFYDGDTSGYNTQSEADMALTSLIAFYTQDKEQIRRIIKRSKLNDKKWDRDNYSELTIGKVLASRKMFTKPFKLTDYGNAERLVYYHGENIRYCEVMKKWFIWDGTRWKCDDTLEIERLAKDTVRRIYYEAGDCENENQRKVIADHAKHSESNTRIQAMISLAKSQAEVVIRPEDFDRDGFLLNCENGTIDLRSGNLLSHRREDFITKKIPVVYDTNATCPRWTQFLAEVFNNDTELIEFIQRSVGYSLTSSIKEECLFICYGTGRNGKSKFIDTISFLLGDYARTADPSTFEEQKRHSGSATEDIARLRGARFVNTIEVAEGRRLAENLVKKMTGDKLLSARELYQKTIEFEQTYKIWIATNHKPIIRGTDIAIWERILLIPFEVYFPEEKRDKDLFEKLKAEASGILNWALDGCLLWQKHGLNRKIASKVRQATAEYKEEMNVINEFIKEKCILKDDVFITKQDLYMAYQDWCRESGIYAESKISFGRRIREIPNIEDGIGTDKIRIWKGIGLLT